MQLFNYRLQIFTRYNGSEKSVKKIVGIYAIKFLQNQYPKMPCFQSQNVYKIVQTRLKEHVALDRTIWSIKSV